MWLNGFEKVTFPQSLGFPHRAPVTRVVWHGTAGWCAEHAFNVYRDAPKGACPNVTAEYAGTGGSGTTRYTTKRPFMHVPLDLASYALQRGNPQHPCRVETNGAGCIQIERVGFPDDVVTVDEHRWLGETILAPILRACPLIPPSVFQGDYRMGEDEWAAWPGGQCRHRNVCCQPDNHIDPPELDLDLILEYALRANDPPPPLPESDMIVLKVTDDPQFPGGVLLELSGNGLAWIQSGNLHDVYTQGGVKTVDVVKARVDDILLTKNGVGPSPSTVGSIVAW